MSELLEYFGGDELAADVWEMKYGLRNEKGELVEKTPEDTHRRIAKELARIEARKFKKPLSEDEIFSYLDRYKYIIPQGSPTYAIGNPYAYVTTSNCYVVDAPEDSYGGIHWTDEQLTQISKRRGGVGIDISNIRPIKLPTKNSSKFTTGLIPFAQRYSNSIEEVGQDGRRGALMLTLDVHHPQVLDFARAKLDEVSVTGANISIRLSDEFLIAVKNNTTYQQRWPVQKDAKHVISQQVSAREVWLEIIKCAHARAEPGLLFWDRIIGESPADCYAGMGFRTISTNPCGELPLCTCDSCRLLVLNLFSYVIHPFTKDAYFDFGLFYKHCQIAQRLMDDIIDIELECIDRIIDKINADPESKEIKQREVNLWKRIKEKCANGRRTGTGITALGDTLAALGIPYASKKGIGATERIYQTLKFGCYRSSIDMAKELGAFPIWNAELEKNNPFLNRIKNESIDICDPHLICDLGAEMVVLGSTIYKDMQKYGRRNIALLTTAPVGTISIVAQTTSGIEPLTFIEVIRSRKINPHDTKAKVDFVDQKGVKWQKYSLTHPKLIMWQEITGITDISKSPYIGSCAEELNWPDRVKLQAAAQKHVDHSISSTLNLPENVTVEQVAEIYETAWKAGCKGVTVYRKNCRQGVIQEKVKRAENHAIKRPPELPCDIYHIVTKGKKYYVFVGLLDNEPYEIFAGREKNDISELTQGRLRKMARGHYNLYNEEGKVVWSDLSKYSDDQEEIITRFISTSLRHRVPLQFLVHQISKVQGDYSNFAKCLIRCLKKYIGNDVKITGESCPQCSSDNLIFQEGCVFCSTCSWSKCS